MNLRRPSHPARARGRRLSYASAAAALALVLSLSSGAIAARHYLLTSTKQIKPRVLAALRATAGRAGAPGAPGAPGAQGLRGPRGETGPQGSLSAAPGVLAPGQTETGVWGGGYEITEGRTRYRLTASFPLALPAPLPEGSVGYVPKGSPPTSACPGAGRAAPSFICLYEAASENLEPPSQAAVFDPEQFAGPSQATGRSGFAIELTAKGEDPSSVSGTFAVTAPRSGEPVAVLALPRDGTRP